MFCQAAVHHAGPVPLRLDIVGSACDVALMGYQFAMYRHHLLLIIKGAGAYTNGPPREFHDLHSEQKQAVNQAEKNE
jgi:hypothetical protein